MLNVDLRLVVFMVNLPMLSLGSVRRYCNGQASVEPRGETAVFDPSNQRASTGRARTNWAAGPWGGMRVHITGRANGRSVVRTWQLTAPAVHGPEIPCMAASLLADRILHGGALAPGGMPCMGLLTLEDFAPEFARWGIRTQVEESIA